MAVYPPLARAIFTTNYDAGVERAYELNATLHQKPIPIIATSDFRDYDLRFEVPVFHLHGSVRGAGKSALVLTDDDFVKFRDRRGMLFELLKTQFAAASLLYIGYSNTDSNWKALLSEVEGEFYPSTMPMSFRITPSTEALDREIFEAKNIITIDATLQEFVEAAGKIVAEASVPQDRLQRERADVPFDLVEIFDNNPAATSRLLANWTYVNQADFAATPNLRQFLNGDLANWSLLAKQTPFERDLESRVLDDVLDYATAQRQSITSILILGSAGYGVSTLLGQISIRLVTDRVGPVLFLRRGGVLNEGDVDFAVRALPDRAVFVIDNAADYAPRLSQLIQSLRQSGDGACFLLGDRINEWRQRRSSIRAREHRLDALSDAEIDRLLGFLDVNNALGELKHLEQSLRFAAVKQKHEKQLLVALREVTDTRGNFDAIIEDEYRSLSRESVRRLYAAVCCFYHLRTAVRDQLLARLLDVQLEDLYREVGEELEGVVEHECINAVTGEYAARARHQVIAQVVWDRCLTQAERDDLALKAIDGLNLSYQLDLLVFDHFVRSDRHVDELSTLDAKTRFFEIACRKAPANPYVRQHYARMLYREGHLEAALGQITTALDMGSARVLFHTKGKILEKMALTTESVEIARRRLAQSEEVHNASRRANPRDGYAYQGLAELYLGWAKRSTDADEVALYITKAETVVTEGLAQVADRESLYIASADIQGWLGDHPGAIEALRRAVTTHSSGEISRYLLGRAYARVHDYGNALEVLRPVIENNPNEYRAGITYARALLATGKSFREAAAVLRLGESLGRRDARYLSMLRGLLVLASELTDAQQVFAVGAEMAFTYDELNRNLFRPFVPGEPETC